MAQREIPQEWRVLMDRKGIPSMRKLAEKAGLGHTTIYRVVFRAGHETTDEVIQAIAGALNVDYTVIYQIVGRGPVQAERWVPPAISALMTAEQRKVVEQMIHVMVNGTTVVDHPERGHLRLAADTSHGLAEDQS